MFIDRAGGEGGIRTPDRLAPMPHFECGAFDHSATSPALSGARPLVGPTFRRGWAETQAVMALRFRGFPSDS